MFLTMEETKKSNQGRALTPKIDHEINRQGSIAKPRKKQGKLRIFFQKKNR